MSTFALFGGQILRFGHGSSFLKSESPPSLIGADLPRLVGYEQVAEGSETDIERRALYSLQFVWIT
jgi:hypothetical protein